MLTVISPAKKLDYSEPVETKIHTQPALLKHSQELLKGLKTLSPQDVCALMGLSDKLGALNYERFQEWRTPFNQKNARQAVLAFKGDVYQGLDAQSMNEGQLAWAQDNLRILSGLYGLLRPLDLMQPYRLEMGTKYSNSRGSDLYKFWGNIITNEINNMLEGKAPVLLNLASNEYFKAVHVKDIKGQIISPQFMDKKDDKYKIISFFAKRARGLMSAYIIKNKITDVEKIKGFDTDGYKYNAAMSEGDKWVFTRG
ncbi:peroxide stress protein YaaA [SAR92 clade bacterium H921]|nr:peroxide stress protein YaaA [SAR92 clade bacterium H921]MDA9664400.1 peroxide stress protein YaaA [bacterium]